MLCHLSGANNVSVRAARIVHGRTKNDAAIGRASKTSSRDRSWSCIGCRAPGFALPVYPNLLSNLSIWIGTFITGRWLVWSNRKRSLIFAEGNSFVLPTRRLEKNIHQKNARLLGTFSANEREFTCEMNAVNKGVQQLSYM